MILPVMVGGIVAKCGGCSCATYHCYIDVAWFTELA